MLKGNVVRECFTCNLRNSLCGELNYVGTKDSYLTSFKLFERNDCDLPVTNVLSSLYPIMYVCFFNGPIKVFLIPWLKLPNPFPKTVKLFYNIYIVNQSFSGYSYPSQMLYHKLCILHIFCTDRMFWNSQYWGKCLPLKSYSKLNPF